MHGLLLGRAWHGLEWLVVGGSASTTRYLTLHYVGDQKFKCNGQNVLPTFLKILAIKSMCDNEYRSTV